MYENGSVDIERLSLKSERERPWESDCAKRLDSVESE